MFNFFNRIKRRAFTYVYDQISFSNTTDELALEVSGLEIDRVVYGPGWPVASGFSMALSSTATSTFLNDDPINWCPGVPLLPSGDAGTPGEVNDFCP